ncbi:hypothetical protein [Microbacterium sp. NPDC057650]|uniref:hypothetical protein n=1 Tax=unclassified Microbacterium TaxID=2609290 RepID=UPI00366FFC79
MALPDSIFEAKRLADPRAVLRVVTQGEPSDRLPQDAAAWVGRSTSVPKMILKTVLVIAITVGGVWVVTVNAWDHDNFFPWYWNVIWTIFPWVFLGPLWAAFFRSLSRKPANDRFRKEYAAARGNATATVGRVVNTKLAQTDSGGVAEYVASVADADGEFIVNRLAVGTAFAPFEAPQPGEAVHLWRFPEGWTLIQTARGGARATNPDAGDDALPAQLERLARLHRSGDLTDEQFDLAKQKLIAG